MADREDNTYRAKLAEQAERYDGKFYCYLNTSCYAIHLLELPVNDSFPW